ncbi:MAG: cyclase family protein [Brevefilum sp.]|nr:cyclase family protein [Brevefilum sp.]
MKIFDISVPITPEMPVWPGDPAVDLQQVSAIASGELANITHISMSVHTGTHIDAPKHFIDSGKTVGQIPLEKLVGEVLLMQMDDSVNVISELALQIHPAFDLLKDSRKVLFRTRNSSLWRTSPNEFRMDYVGIDKSGAEFLAALGLDLIGVDYLSIAPFDETLTPHQTLLTKEIVLLEGLDLSNIPAGIYELYCLPISLPGCEGAPARVILVDRLQ